MTTPTHYLKPPPRQEEQHHHQEYIIVFQVLKNLKNSNA
jgi:hypothetical protein